MVEAMQKNGNIGGCAGEIRVATRDEADRLWRQGKPGPRAFAKNESWGFPNMLNAVIESQQFECMLAAAAISLPL